MDSHSPLTPEGYHLLLVEPEGGLCQVLLYLKKFFRTWLCWPHNTLINPIGNQPTLNFKKNYCSIADFLVVYHHKNFKHTYLLTYSFLSCVSTHIFYLSLISITYVHQKMVCLFNEFVRLHGVLSNASPAADLRNWIIHIFLNHVRGNAGRESKQVNWQKLNITSACFQQFFNDKVTYNIYNTGIIII